MLRLILRQAFALVGIGLAAGLLLAVVTSQLLASQLVGISALDVPSYAVTLIVVMATALVACAVPARTAMQLSPIAALRRE